MSLDVSAFEFRESATTDCSGSNEGKVGERKKGNQKRTRRYRRRNSRRRKRRREVRVTAAIKRSE